MQEQMFKNGISLIVLLIMMVILILVVTTIIMKVNERYVDNATRDNGLAKQEEQRIAKGNEELNEIKYDLREDFTAEIESGSERFSAIYPDTSEYKEIIDGVETTTAWIPKGFAVGISEGINKVADGLVIQDEKGNQFVWIPISATTTSEFDALRNYESYEYNYYEPYSGKDTEEQIEYELLRKKIIEKGGFYIGRYETGSTTPRNIESPGTTSLVVKRDAYPYNNVGWGTTMKNYTEPIIYRYESGKSYDYGYGAVYLSKNMYNDNKKYGVISTLCYGVQWDAMLSFMGKTNEQDSTSWGNYADSTWEITRQTASYCQNDEWYSISDGPIQKKKYEDILLTTGANDEFQQKNIFDVGGNVCEWTMENYSAFYRVVRGDNCLAPGTYYHSVTRRDSYYPNHVNSLVGFRITLCVL